MALFEHLGHVGHVTEVRVVPKDGSPVLTGFFENQSQLASVCAQYQSAGKTQIGLLPRPRTLFERAPNVMRGYVPTTLVTDIKFVTCVTLTPPMQWEDEDIVKMVERFRAKGQPAPLVLQCSGAWSVVHAIKPVEICEDNRNEILAVLQTMSKQYGIVMPGTVSTTDLLQWLDWPIDTHTPSEYTHNLTIGAFFPRSIATGLPKVVLQKINEKPRSNLAKLYRGVGKIDLLEADGSPFVATPENLDRRFLDEVAGQWRSMPIDELAAAVFTRQDGHAKGKGRSYCVQIAIDARAANQPPSVVARGEANDDSPFSDEDQDVRPLTLKQKVYALTFEDRQTAFDTFRARRQGVPIFDKAEMIVEHIRTSGGRFYYNVLTNTASMVYKGKQLIVDVNDSRYCAWFDTEIGCDQAKSSHGTQLTRAISSYIAAHDENEDFLRVKKSEWGHYDRKNGIIYLCMDPNNAEIIRIAPAKDGVPDVSIVKNGFDKIVLKCMDGRETRFIYHKDNAKGWDIFRDDVHGGQALLPIIQLASTCYNLAAIIPGHLGRPIKHHKGGQGSGKSFAMYDIEQAFYGRRVATGYQRREALSSSVDSTGPFITFDNCEAEQRDTFRPLFRLFATGASDTTRRLYTNSERVNYVPNGTLIITAIEGESMIEDLERVFEFEFIKIRQANLKRLSEVARAEMLCEHSNLITSALFDMLSLHVLPNIHEKLESALSFVRTRCKSNPKARNNDFLLWMLVMMDALAPHLYTSAPAVVPDENGEPYNNGEPVGADTPRELFYIWLDKQSKGHKAADRDANQVLEALETIKDAALTQMHKTGVIGNDYPRATTIEAVCIKEHDGGVWVIGPMTIPQLYRLCCKLWKDLGRRIPWKVARNLGDRMRTATTNLEESGWVAHKQKRKIGNNDVWCLQYDPPLDNVILLPLPPVVAVDDQ